MNNESIHSITQNPPQTAELSPRMSRRALLNLAAGLGTVAAVGVGANVSKRLLFGEENVEPQNATPNYSEILINQGYESLNPLFRSSLRLYNELTVVPDNVFTKTLLNGANKQYIPTEFEGWGTLPEEDLFSFSYTKAAYPNHMRFVRENEYDGNFQNDVRYLSLALNQYIPHLIISASDIELENKGGINANKHRVHFTPQQPRELAVSIYHEQQHSFDFKPFQDKEYLNLSRVANYYTVVCDSIYNVFKRWSKIPDQKLFNVKGYNPGPLFLPSHFTDDEAALNGNVNKLKKTYFGEPNMESYRDVLKPPWSTKNEAELKSVASLNYVLHKTVGCLFGSDQSLRQKLLKDPLATAFLQGASNELHHYFVGPVQSLLDGGFPYNTTPMQEIIPGSDILSDYNYSIELARLAIAHPDNPRQTQYDMWNEIAETTSDGKL